MDITPRADIIIDLAYGDSGKGKVCKHKAMSGYYTHCLRFNGGNNAGHTVYHSGKKFVTHQIPCGIFYGLKSIIGATCVVNVDELFSEIQMLEDGGINTKGLVYVANNAHVITQQHIEEDGKDTKIGTTKRGIGPCYSSKASRNGTRAEGVPELKPYLIDVFEELSKPFARILCEGAQGFYLDIDWGDYPYVTSSPCTVASVIQNGITYANVDRVIGVIKAYETYVGAKQFEPSDDIFKKIRDVGGEFGATTGRPRQCNWINLEKLKRAILFNGVNELVINKCDILEKVGEFGLIHPDGTVKKYENFASFRVDLEGFIDGLKMIHPSNIKFSSSPETI